MFIVGVFMVFDYDRKNCIVFSSFYLSRKFGRETFFFKRNKILVRVLRLCFRSCVGTRFSFGVCVRIFVKFVIRLWLELSII